MSKSPLYFKALWATVQRYGWMPFAVFVSHEICAHVFNAYERWPSVDIPLHFFGGFAIAFFTGGLLKVFTKHKLIHEPERLIKILVVFSVACTTAVFWEFAEWSLDRLTSMTCQVSLDDTMLDLFMGALGAFVYTVPLIAAFIKEDLCSMEEG